MFDHIVISSSNYQVAKNFYLKALAPIGIEVLSEGELGIELSTDGETSFCIRLEEETPSHLHLAFRADNRSQVDAFYHAAISAGARDYGAPGIRPNYTGKYYAAFVIGPDGHNIEVVCHEEAIG